MPSNGVTISVTAETNAGGRKHMEDYIAVDLSPNETLRKIPEMKEQAYVGVFDGHGGKEAAKYAREHLWETIQKQSKFQTHDVDSVKEAILDAYLELHQTMLASRGKDKSVFKVLYSCNGISVSGYEEDCLYLLSVYLSSLSLLWSTMATGCVEEVLPFPSIPFSSIMAAKQDRRSKYSWDNCFNHYF